MDNSFSVTKLRDGSGPALVFINGFLNGEEDDFSEWMEPTLDRFQHNPCYGVCWESGTLKELGYYMGKIGMGIIKPSLLSLTYQLLQNPWHKAYAKSDAAGRSLARWLCESGEESFILMGHSLGAKVAYHALEALAKNNSHRVREVYLLGGAASNNPSDWTKAPGAVSGTIHNMYSERDSVLRFLYRTAQAFTNAPIGYSGLHLIGWSHIVNIDVTQWVKGHSKYKDYLTMIFNNLPRTTVVGDPWDITSLVTRLQSRNAVTPPVLVCGKSGSGKSSLIAALIQVDAKIMDGCGTQKVLEYHGTLWNTNTYVCLLDTPPMGESTTYEDEYQLKRLLPHVASIIWITLYGDRSLSTDSHILHYIRRLCPEKPILVFGNAVDRISRTFEATNFTPQAARTPQEEAACDWLRYVQTILAGIRPHCVLLCAAGEPNDPTRQYNLGTVAKHIERCIQ